VSNGDQGLSGNEDLVVSTESNGVVLAWSRTSGEKMFETDVLKYRKLSAPLVLAQGIVVSDNQGVVYLLSLKDGRLLNKLDTQTQATLGLSQPLDTGFLYASRAGKIRVFNLPLTNVKLTPQ
jgi:outer membrane protein assembly factor BamB